MSIWDALRLGRKREAGGSEGLSAPRFEPLEPRLLLNADVSGLELDSLLAERPIEAAIVVDVVPQDAGLVQQVVTADDTGLSESSLPGASVGVVPETASDGQETQIGQLLGSLTAAEAVCAPIHDRTSPVGLAGDADVSLQSTENGSSVTQQLVETLRAANGPPESHVASLDVTPQLSGVPVTTLASEGRGLVVSPEDTLSGQGIIGQDVYVWGRLSPGNSPGVIEITGDLTFDGADTGVIDDAYVPPAADDTVGTLVIEIGGNTAGSEYDQVRVSGDRGTGGNP